MFAFEFRDKFICHCFGGGNKQPPAAAPAPPPPAAPVAEKPVEGPTVGATRAAAAGDETGLLARPRPRRPGHPRRCSEPSVTVWKYRRAGKMLGALLRAMGYGAVVTPHRVVYVLAERYDDPEIYRHELCHILQILDMGEVRFWRTIVRDYFVCGYSDSPLENAAREYQRRPLNGVR